MVFPIVVALFAALFFFFYVKVSLPKAGTAEWIERAVHKPRFKFCRYPVERRDILPLCLLIALFAAHVLFHPHGPFGQYWEWVWFDDRILSGGFAAFLQHLTLGFAFEVRLLSNALAGAGVLAAFYVFAKNMFGKTRAAFCGTLLVGFTLQLHYLLMPTLPATLFLLLSYFFMYRYVTTPKEKLFKSGVLPLLLSGLFFGLGAPLGGELILAWGGLFVIFGVSLPNNEIDSKHDGYIAKSWLLFLLFLVILPAIILFGSFVMHSGELAAYDQTAQLIAVHTSYRVMLGNPVVWGGGFLAIIPIAVTALKFRDSRAMVILVGGSSALLMWANSELGNFHVPFIFPAAALTHMFDTFAGRGGRFMKLVPYGFVIFPGIVFAAYVLRMYGIHLPFRSEWITWLL